MWEAGIRLKTPTPVDTVVNMCAVLVGHELMPSCQCPSFLLEMDLSDIVYGPPRTNPSSGGLDRLKQGNCGSCPPRFCLSIAPSVSLVSRTGP